MLSASGRAAFLERPLQERPVEELELQGPAPQTAEQVILDLRLIATSDLHACLLPYDYYANRPSAGRSLTEIAQQIATARQEQPNCLLFDNGDFLQGSPLAEFVASVSRRRRTHPVIAAFNALAYDAVTLGNHDFDYGVDFLTRAMAQAQFPVVSANVATSLGPRPDLDQTYMPPFAILQRRLTDRSGRPHDIRIGVIGFAPPQLAVWDREKLEGRVHLRDILDAARSWLPSLKAAGTDLIVALAHSGIGQIDPAEGAENMATALAALPEIDAVIAGHSHKTFPGPGFSGLSGVDAVQGCLAGKPAVMPGHSGSHLGIIDLALEPQSAGPRKWRVVDREVRLSGLSSCDIPGTPYLRRAIAADHRAALAWSRRSLGETKVPLSTHFATTAPSAALALIAAAKVDYARRALAGSELDGLPILASAAPLRSGGYGGTFHYTDIPAGPFRMRNLTDLYPFQNGLVALTMTGADLANWLEHSASIFQRFQPGDRDRPLHDPSFPGFGFDCVPGLDYAFDLTQPARFDAQGNLVDPSAQRVVGLSLASKPLDPSEFLVLVTNSHRAGRGPTGLDTPSPIALPRVAKVPAIIADYIRRRGPTIRNAPRNWHFLPMPGTTATVRTGATADRHLSEVGHLRPRFLYQDAEGFRHYRLHL